MPVQFNCAACGKPIEIDDEFAGQAVTCPYCRGVVKAPPAGGPPVAAPLDLPPPDLASSPTGPSPAVVPNWFATAGLMCAVVIVLAFCTSLGMIVKTVQTEHPDGRINQAQLQELMDRASKMPLMIAVQWIILIAAVMGTILSILGLTRRQGRRWQAIIGVTISGLFLTCVALSLVMALAGRAIGK
jgi:hypothetical protein